MKRSAPPRKRRPGAPRRGPLRSPSFRRWLVENFKCAVCDSPYVQAAHTVNNGQSSKGPDSTCVTLCCRGDNHHAEYDAGRAAFEQKYHTSLPQVAALQWKCWVMMWATPREIKLLHENWDDPVVNARYAKENA